MSEPSGLTLFGRRKECGALDELRAGARAGRSGVLVLHGDAGVGKSALLGYAIASAPDMTVLRATGAQSEMELPFAALHQFCAPMVTRLDRLPGPQRDALRTAFGLSAGPVPDRFFVALAVLSLLSEAARERPVLCVVDDAQWLDRASAQALAFVARRLWAEPVVMLFAARELAGELGRLPDRVVEGLRHADAHAVLDMAVPFILDERVRDRIIAETHGNPLALLELPRGLTAMELAGGFGGIEAPALPRRIEENFARRLQALPDDTRLLLILASADPVGNPLLLRRAAESLGIDRAAAADAESAGLLAIDERVTFRHPLARSAIYHSATLDDRRTVHLALAQATDRDADPDRRAWHLGAGTLGPDEEVASELERSADRAQARGGLAAAAAFLARAVALTPDDARRVDRALAGAQASIQAGALDVAARLVATARADAADELQRARADLQRARIAFVSSRGGAAPGLLLSAIQRVEPLDRRLARGSYLEALSAVLFAGRLAAPGGSVRDVANAVRSAAPAPTLRSGADLLLDGWAALFADGCAAAAPTLCQALEKFNREALTADELHLLWLVTITAPVVWDDVRWDVLSRRHVDLARKSGALTELPLALNSRAFVHLFRGEFDTAAGLIEEAAAAVEATGASLTPWGVLALAVLRGREQEATKLLEVAGADASERGEGISWTVVAWARALLYNGLGVHDKAFAFAQEAVDCPTNSAAAAWAMVELVEAGIRIGEREAAAEAAARFAEIATAAGTDWGLGVSARSRALLSDGTTAEELYRESLARLGRCQMRVDRARALLLYGEWLLLQGRRVDARAHLQPAGEMFATIGMEAFADRACAAPAMKGVKVRKGAIDTDNDLTPQEHQVARLARDGMSNAEIGSRLFISQHTVAYHLRKVFGKLEIRSRRELAAALPSSESEVVSA